MLDARQLVNLVQTILINVESAFGLHAVKSQTRNNHFSHAYQTLASVFVDLNAIFLRAKSESTL